MRITQVEQKISPKNKLCPKLYHLYIDPIPQRCHLVLEHNSVSIWRGLNAKKRTKKPKNFERSHFCQDHFEQDEMKE